MIVKGDKLKNTCLTTSLKTDSSRRNLKKQILELEVCEVKLD